MSSSTEQAKFRKPEEQALRDSLPSGIRSVMNPLGVRVFQLFFWADPDKRSDEWEISDRKGLAPELYSREMYQNTNVYLGRAVFPSFKNDVHNPREFRNVKFPACPDCVYIGGWDAGDTMRPAFHLLRITPRNQIQSVGELAPATETDAYSFADMVTDYLIKNFPEVQQIRHCGDETIRRRVGTDKRTVKSVLLERGFNVRPMTNLWALRFNDMNRALNDYIEYDEGGKQVLPRYVVNQEMCPITVEGFLGAYKYPELREDVAPESPDAVLNYRPLKNHPWSDVHDALQYAMMLAFKYIEGSGITIHRRIRRYNEEKTLSRDENDDRSARVKTLEIA